MSAQPPPKLQAPARPAAPSKLEATENAFLLDLDEGREPKPAQDLGAPDRAAFEWLQRAAAWKEGSFLASPFPKVGADAKEAEAWKAFLAGGLGDAERLPLRLTGSRLLLWSWARAQERKGPLAKARRQAIEDRLLSGGPAVIRGWALRHALCFAVAERDLARFADLKGRYGADAPDTFSSIQSLFGMLDGPSPDFRLWKLPGLAYQDGTLADLGAQRVWVCPPGPAVPEGAAWIIPSESGDQNDREAALSEPQKAEAQALAAQAGRPAWYAASRQAWEAAGLQWFPILIELDANGNVKAVRMGDAAP